MTKKNFKDMTNPAEAFFGDADNSSTPTPVKTKQTSNSRRKSSKNSSETRSHRATILITPTTAQSLKIIAQFEDTSVNGIINHLLEDYIADYKKNGKNASKLKQALKLFTK